ncbi:MAG: tRNA (N6-threonylcarbamoyladenosine(37)-N6)-methyltransferase TrmO [Chloroflexota bacterium]
MAGPKVEFEPIGVVRTELGNDAVKESWPRGIEAGIEVFEACSEALDGIEDFSHLIVLFHMHETTEEQRKTMKARPRRFTRYGLRLEDLPLVGVFCLDSPHRPNPIGISIVTFLGREGNTLRVTGLDAFDGTPVLDIKPYTPDRCRTQLRLPHWFRLLWTYLQGHRSNQ